MFVTVDQLQSVVTLLIALAFIAGLLGAFAAFIAIDIFNALGRWALTAFASTKKGKALKAKLVARERQQLIKFVRRNPFILTRWETRTNEERKRLAQLRAEVANGSGTGH